MRGIYTLKKIKLILIANEIVNALRENDKK